MNLKEAIENQQNSAKVISEALRVAGADKYNICLFDHHAPARIEVNSKIQRIQGSKVKLIKPAVRVLFEIQNNGVELIEATINDENELADITRLVEKMLNEEVA